MTAKDLLAADPGAPADPIRGRLRSVFHSDAIPNIDVRKFRVGLLKRKELTEGGPNMMFGIRFPRGKFAFAKPSRSHIVSGGQADGGGEKAARDGN
jgi:hypothetical protein